MKPRIIAVHLLNDRSGSPLVLKQALEALQQDYDITLFTATPSGDGFLSELGGIRTCPVFYRWSKNRCATLAFFLWAQIILFAKLLRFLRPDDKVYINTLLPFGAALAARLRGCFVLYHVHEVSLRPALLHRVLVGVAGAAAQRILFVSNYVAGEFSFERAQTEVVYNSLPRSFTNATEDIARENWTAPFTVLMLCSMKAYKGLDQFLQIATRLPYASFELVLNAADAEVGAFCRKNRVPDNCRIYSSQADTTPFYKRAHVVVNLSLPDAWIETFGMTVLEAMHCGRPVIVPTVGGVRELVTHGQQGYCIDSRHVEEIATRLRALSSDLEMYRSMSAAAYRRSLGFSAESFRSSIVAAFDIRARPATHSRRGGETPVLADDDYDVLFQ